MSRCPTCGQPIDAEAAELPPVVFAWLRDRPDAMLYRGNGSERWWLSGPNSPVGPLGRAAVMAAVAQGLLVEMWPGDPRVGTDALTVPTERRAEAGGAEGAAKRGTG